LKVPLIGLVENMSYFIAPSGGERYYIFGKDGRQKTAEEYDIPFLGQIRLSKYPEGGDIGIPLWRR